MFASRFLEYQKNKLNFNFSKIGSLELEDGHFIKDTSHRSTF